MIETITVPGEPPCPRPWYKKINPLWWFGNDEASAVGNTFVYKYIRNPLQNFRWYVIGVVDRDHTVTAAEPAMANMWSEADEPKTGWKFARVAKVLPYIAYNSRLKDETGDGFVFQLGWQPRGGLSGRLTGLKELFNWR